VRVAADTHAIVWFVHESTQLSERALRALRGAQDDEGIAVPAGVLFDLWYVTKSTKDFTEDHLRRVQDVLSDPARAVDLSPIDGRVFEAWEAIGRNLISDPWDRMIMAGAITLGVPLVTKDRAITASGLVETVW
jgi:PIN domain nuclease of toxin-antitoxin system